MKEFMVHVQEVLFHQDNLLMLKEKEQIHVQKDKQTKCLMTLIYNQINNKYGH